VRPNTAQPYYLFLRNKSGNERDVTVQILAADKKTVLASATMPSVPRDLDGSKAVRVTLAPPPKPMPPAGAAPAAPAPMPATPPAGADGQPNGPAPAARRGIQGPGESQGREPPGFFLLHSRLRRPRQGQAR